MSEESEESTFPPYPICPIAFDTKTAEVAVNLAKDMGWKDGEPRFARILVALVTTQVLATELEKTGDALRVPDRAFPPGRPGEETEKDTPSLESVVNLYIAYGPRPPTEDELIWIGANIMVNADYKKRVYDYVDAQDLQRIVHPQCEIYTRHIRLKRRHILGPEPILDKARAGPVEDGRPIYAVSPLYPGKEYDVVFERMNGFRAKRTAQSPWIPLGAPIVNGMQSLISIAPVSGDIPIEISMNSAHQPYSTKLVEDLQLMGVKDLEAHGVQTDKYFICRTIDRPAVWAGVSISVADPMGHVIRLDLHGVPIQPISLRCAQLTEYHAMFPLGTILLVKEPYFDTELDQPRISVYSPTDMEIISLKDPLVTKQPWRVSSQLLEGGEEIKLRDYERLGTFKRDDVDDLWQHFAGVLYDKKDYFWAEISCTKAITNDPTGPDIANLYTLRAECRLKLERYYEAEADAEKAIDCVLQVLAKGDAGKKRKKTLGTLLHKVMLLSAVACYSRRDWKAALVAFERLCERYSDSAPGKQGIQMAKERLKESQTGEYDWFALYNSAKAGQFDVQIGDFIGPVEERDIPGMGKGLVATRDIRAGEAVMVERALEMFCVDPDEVLEPNDTTTSCIILSGYHYKFWAFRVSLLYKAYWQPEIHKQLKALYSGTEDEARPPFPYNDETDYRGAAREPIDSRAIDAISSFNLFETSVEEGPMAAKGVRSLNVAIKKSRSPNKGNVAATAKTKEREALFPSLCLFNNSCKPNCHRVALGRVKAIRANEDIPAGTELTITYNGINPFAERCVKLERLMGVPCTCRLCQDDAKDGLDAHVLRKKCRDALDKRAAGNEKVTMHEIDQMLATYGQHRDGYRPDLTKHYYELAWMNKTAFYHEKTQRQVMIAINNLLNMLRSIGVEMIGDPEPKAEKRTVKALEGQGLPIRTLPYRIPEKAVEVMIDLSVWYALRTDRSTSLAWKKAAEKVHALTVVPCAKVFQDKYNDVCTPTVFFKNLIAEIG